MYKSQKERERVCVCVRERVCLCECVYVCLCARVRVRSSPWLLRAVFYIFDKSCLQLFSPSSHLLMFPAVIRSQAAALITDLVSTPSPLSPPSGQQFCQRFVPAE